MTLEVALAAGACLVVVLFVGALIGVAFRCIAMTEKALRELSTVHLSKNDPMTARTREQSEGRKVQSQEFQNLVKKLRYKDDQDKRRVAQARPKGQPSKRAVVPPSLAADRIASGWAPFRGFPGPSQAPAPGPQTNLNRPLTPPNPPSEPKEAS